MDLTTLLLIIFFCIAFLAGGVAIGYWLWGTTPSQVEALQEEHAQYKDDVNSHMTQMLTAVDDLRLQIRRSASDLGDPISDGKLERLEGDQVAALESTEMPSPPLALDTDVSTPVVPVEAINDAADMVDMADNATVAVNEPEAKSAEPAKADVAAAVNSDDDASDDVVIEAVATKTDIKDAKPAAKAS